MNKVLETDIISALGLDGLTDEKKTEILEQMTDVVLKSISLRVVNLLSEDDLKEYLRILDRNKDHAHEFLLKKLPIYPSIVNEEVIKFKKEILSQGNSD